MMFIGVLDLTLQMMINIGIRTGRWGSRVRLGAVASVNIYDKSGENWFVTDIDSWLIANVAVAGETIILPNIDRSYYSTTAFNLINANNDVTYLGAILADTDAILAWYAAYVPTITYTTINLWDYDASTTASDADKATLIANNNDVLVNEPDTGYAIVNSELTTYTTGLATELTDTQLENLDTLITSVKTTLSISALADRVDILRIVGGETFESSLKNLAKDADHASLVNAPSFTQYEGFAGNGSSSYLNSNYNPAVDGVNFALDSASYGIYFRTFNEASTGYNGAYISGATTSRVFIGFNTALAGVLVGLNAGYYKPVSTFAGGMILLSRTSSAGFSAYLNKTKYDTTNTSVAVPNQSTYLGALHDQDGIANYHNQSQMAVEWAANGLTQAEAEGVTDAIEAYMDANGKGVVA